MDNRLLFLVNIESIWCKKKCGVCESRHFLLELLVFTVRDLSNFSAKVNLQCNVCSVHF